MTRWSKPSPLKGARLRRILRQTEERHTGRNILFFDCGHSKYSMFYSDHYIKVGAYAFLHGGALMTRRYREDNERLVKIRNYYVRRPQATPFRVTASDHLKDVGEILLGVIVLLVLFIGLPMLLWLAFG